MLRTPEHLAGQIRDLRRPIREMNRDFLKKVTESIKLRPGLDEKKVLRYLESMEYSFRSLLYQYQEEQKPQDIHTMLEAAEELVDMGLFGVAVRTDG